MSLVGSSYSYMIGSLKDHDKTLNKVIKILKNKYDKKTKLKFILASGIFSEEHSEAIQIINI